MRRTLITLSCSLVCLATSPSQQFEAVQGSFGVSTCRGELLAGGPSYTATFLPQGPAYTPLLGNGAAAATPMPATVQFAFVEARVGSQVLAVGGHVVPTAADQVVQYDRGAVLERYEARVDGIEQSFVLRERPAAAGDFVVRGRVATALPLTANGADEVCFQLPDGGGVRFGAVTGVDAAGATARGGMQYRDGMLELTLPAAFVATATYPLVLDPLVGTVLTVGDAANVDDVHPAAAFDASTGRFLVVWTIDFPASFPLPAQTHVRGQFVVPGGGLVGTQLVLDNDATFGTHVAIANVNATNRFLVAWKGTASLLAQGVIGCSVAASNGALSNIVPLDTAFLGGFDDHMALGGDSRAAGGSYALVAVRGVVSGGSGQLPTSNDIRVRRVLVPASGDPAADPNPLSVASSSNLLDDVAVTAHAGTAGRWLVVFGQSVTSMAGPMQRVLGQLVAANGTLCGTPITIRNAGTTGNLDQPTVATRDGVEFVVGWHDGVSNDVQLRRCEITGICGGQTTTFGAIVSPLLSAGLAHSPALAFVKDKYLLAWQQYQSGWRVFTKGIDPATCGNCGSEQRVDQPVVVDGMPAVASAWEGGDTTSEYGFVAFCEGGAVKARHWDVHGTPVITSLGGGCGISGLSDVATYSGHPWLGDSTFQVSLANPTALVVALVVGFSQLNLPCGPCTLVPSPDLMLPGGNPTPIPIPCETGLIGFELYTQWVQFRQAGCTLLPDLALSNCLKFTIAE